MKAISFKLALQTAVLTAVFSTAGLADGGDAAGPAKGDVQTKVEYCKNCHGAAGEGFHGYYTAPRIAGQTVKYFENQFKALLDRKRDDPIAKMFMVHALDGMSPSTRAGVASYFSRLNPPPLERGRGSLAAKGKKIYEDGVPDASVPACFACHGQDAKGDAENPRLAGQLSSYTAAQLAGWTKYRQKDPTTPGASNVMAQIASNLTKPQIEALSAYLSSLK